MPNELDQFLADNPEEQDDVLTQPFEKPEGAEEEPEEDEEEVKPKTRRERRLLKKLADERESAIFLAGKLEAQEDAKKYIKEADADYIQGIERIFGTDSAEAIAATELLKKAIVGVREDAENRAYSRIQSERQQEQAQVQKAEQELDSIIDDIEDQFDTELTPAQEKAYFALLQKMSPKDRDGNVISLADPYAVYEIFQEKQQKPDNRAKALSARSMVKSGASVDTKLSDDVLARELQKMGII